MIPRWLATVTENPQSLRVRHRRKRDFLPRFSNVLRVHSGFFFDSERQGYEDKAPTLTWEAPGTYTGP